MWFWDAVFPEVFTIITHSRVDFCEWNSSISFGGRNPLKTQNYTLSHLLHLWDLWFSWTYNYASLVWNKISAWRADSYEFNKTLAQRLLGFFWELLGGLGLRKCYNKTHILRSEFAIVGFVDSVSHGHCGKDTFGFHEARCNETFILSTWALYTILHNYEKTFLS
jgi:hypothetical protein